MTGLVLPSALAAVSVALLVVDAVPFVRAWNTSPALLPRRESFTLRRAASYLRSMGSLARKVDGADWEQICYSLAFHLRAGESPVQAVRCVASEGDSSPYEVLSTVARGYDAGSTLSAALSAQGSQSEELRQIASVLEMGTASGGNIPALLCHTAEALRRRRLDKGELRSKLAEARATAVLLSLLPWVIGVFTFTQDPSSMQAVLSDPQGRVLLAGAVVLWIVGNVTVVLLLRTLVPRRTGERRTPRRI